MVLTQLQKEFAISCMRRPGIDPIYGATGLITAGERRHLKGMYNATLGPLPEPAIKVYLAELLQCYDVSAEDKAEAIRLLQLSQTTLTHRQREIIRQTLAN